MQPGYIVILKNDTVRGFIDYRNWEKNPDKIEFSHPNKDRTTTYTPQDIKSFEVGNEIYESGIVTMDNSPFKTEELSEEVKYNYITDTVFLQNLVKGDKSLYLFMDLNGKENFFTGNGSNFELLIYKRYLKRDDLGYLDLAEDKRFIGQLTLYLSDCRNLQSKLPDVKYEKKYLVDLFLFYYKCSKKTIASQNKAISKPYELGAFAGLSLIKFRYYDGPAYLKNVDYPLSKNFSAGLFFNLIFPRHFGRLSLCNELQYSSFKTESSYTDAYIDADTKIGLHYLQMNNMLRLKYPVKNISCFINAGSSVGIGFTETNYKKQVSSFQTSPESIGKALDKLNKAYMGVCVGIGVKLKKYSFETRYQSGFKKPDDLNGASHPYSKTNSVFFLLRYQF